MPLQDEPHPAQQSLDKEVANFMAVLNGSSCPGENRWIFLLFTFFPLFFMGFFIFQETPPVPPLANPLLWISMLGLLLFSAMAVSEWAEWLKWKEGLFRMNSYLEEAIRQIKAIDEHDTETEQLSEELSSNRQAWLLQAALGVAAFILALLAHKWIPKIIIIGVGFLAGLNWLFCMIHVLMYTKSVSNLEGGDRNELALELLIAEKYPYALYLRDFERESNVADAMPPFPDMPPPHEVTDRERKILEKIVTSIPVFALTNYQDMNFHPVAIRVNLAGVTWQTHFHRYAQNASLIILSTDRLSLGIRYELQWIEENDAWSKSLLVLPEGTLKAFRRESPRLWIAPRWIVKTSSSHPRNIPSGLVAYLDELARQRKPLLR